MSPVNNFSTAAHGKNIARSAQITDVVVMGKNMDKSTAPDIAAAIARYVEDGVARPVNALTASTIAAPSGGLAPKGHETAPYKYRGAEMFGLENPGAK